MERFFVFSSSPVECAVPRDMDTASSIEVQYSILGLQYASSRVAAGAVAIPVSSFSRVIATEEPMNQRVSLEIFLLLLLPFIREEHSEQCSIAA